MVHGALALLLAASLLSARAIAEEAARWVLGSEHLRVLYWPEDDELARLARDVGEQSVTRLRGLLDAEPPTRIEVFIVRSQREFEELTGSRSTSWVIGRALLGRRRVVVKPMGEQRLPKLLAHELAHIMLDVRMAAAADKVPRWLHEGIAQYAAGQWSEADARVIADAALSDELLALDDLDAAFGGNYEQVALAYAQSHTLVMYLASLRPAVGLGPLLDQLARGRDVRTALGRAYGIPAPRIEKDWLEHTRTAYLPSVLPVPSELIVGGAFVVAFALAVIVVRWRSARIRRRMEEEERLRELLGRMHVSGDQTHPRGDEAQPPGGAGVR